MHKKKTTVKKGEKSPIFNESMIFNVQAHALQVNFFIVVINWTINQENRPLCYFQNIQLRLTVAEVNSEQGSNSKAHSIGHVIVGAASTGRALAHWRQMLAALRRPIAMWHPLRKVVITYTNSNTTRSGGLRETRN